jgi:hypothetical protein
MKNKARYNNACMPVIPALRRLRQEDHEFKTSLGYIARPCLKIKEEYVWKDLDENDHRLIHDIANKKQNHN